MGRMGNQMFQYACAKNLELIHGFTCSLDDMKNLKYFKISPQEHLKNWLKMKFFFQVARRLKGVDVYNLDFDDMENDYSKWLIQREKPSMIWGFFQSDRYFVDSAEEIKAHFRIKNKYQKSFFDFLNKNKLQQNGYNAIHIRRTDYKGFHVKSLSGDDFTLPMNYYENLMPLFNPQLPIVVVSDDLAFCKEYFGNNEKIIYSSESAIIDFQLLSNAHQLGISNSTFAWWAAYLNVYAGDQVYCPKYFLGFKENKEIPFKIYPKQWKQISVY